MEGYNTGFKGGYGMTYYKVHISIETSYDNSLVNSKFQNPYFFIFSSIYSLSPQQLTKA